MSPKESFRLGELEYLKQIIIEKDTTIMELKCASLLKDNLISELQEKLKSNKMYVPKTSKFPHSTGKVIDDMDMAEYSGTKSNYLSDILALNGKAEWALPKEFESFSLNPSESDIHRIWSPVSMAESISSATKINDPVLPGEIQESLKCLTQRERSSYRVIQP